MGMNIVPFDNPSNLPAYLSSPQDTPNINADVVRAPAFPVLSIKGKQFTLKKDGQKKIITKPNDPDEVAQSLGVVILRSNLRTSVLYLKSFTEGDSEGAIPDCWTNDGVVPSPHAKAPQSKKCAVCPHRVWGSRVSEDARPGEEKKGRACSDQGRLAIAAPDKLEEPMLLRVPPASLKNLREAVKIIDGRKLQYNMVVMKISFDREAASPTLLFKPIGILNDPDYAKAREMYDSEIVRVITGLDEDAIPTGDAPAPEGPVSSDELDAAIAAREASDKAKAAAAKPEPKTEAPKETAPRKARNAPKVDADEVGQAVDPTPPAQSAQAASTPAAAPAASGASALLSDLDSLLGTSDD